MVAVPSSLLQIIETVVRVSLIHCKMDFSADYKDAEFADAELVLKVKAADPARAKRATKRQRCEAPKFDVLAKFPAHRVVLCKCPYFAAQARRWTAGASTSSGSLQQLEWTLDGAEQLAPAEAIIATLYGVGDELTQLDTEQLLQAVLLADRLEVPATAQQALALLQGAAEAAQGLAPATLDALASLGSWPSCLVPLLTSIAGSWHKSGSTGRLLSGETAAYKQRVQAILVAVLGRLDDVWPDQQLQDVLLALPLPAMRLLLASDQLTVGSEDTVLYTAQQYVNKQHRGSAQTAKGTLAKLVRCPHLSRFCLSGLALTIDSSRLVSQYQGQLRELLSQQLVATDAAHAAGSADGVVQRIAGAPVSWQSGSRQLCTQGPVSVVWRLPVQQLAESCRSCSAANPEVWLYSPGSPPKGGYAWQVTARLFWDGEGDKQGVRVGLYGCPADAPAGTYYSAKLAMAAGSVGFMCVAPTLKAAEGWGWDDFCAIGPMSGGWDEAAWAAKGLPTSGELEIKLTVHEVLGC